MNEAETPMFSSPEEELSYWKAKAIEYKTSLDETREELEEFQSSSRELENELEAQLEQQELRCSELRQQINRLAIENQVMKEKIEKEQAQFFMELTKLQEELTEIKNNKERLIKYIRELEQANDDLERAKRATVTSLEDFETRLNQAIERNAFLESELDEKEALKEMVQRLKDEARDLRQEVSVQQRNKNSIPDNDAAIKQLVTKQQLNEQQQQSLSHSSSPYIDSNKFLNEREMIDQSIKSRNSCHTIRNLSNGNVPMTPSARISALNIVGDLLRKVGALESRLASCRTLVKDNQRPLSLPSSGNHDNNHSARANEFLSRISPLSPEFEIEIISA
ncbi:UNVERIFIED_CONTAM: hypothetical protein RMT77_004536 [Armadillidium vulgare]